MKIFEKRQGNLGRIGAAALASLLLLGMTLRVAAWERIRAQLFAILPAGSTGPEGLTVGPDGNVYVTTFGFNSQGAVSSLGQLFVYNPEGQLLRQVSIAGSSSHLLGLRFNPTTGDLIVLDFGNGKALKVNPVTGASSVFMTVTGNSGLNALTFDRAGNVYVSDSFQGIVWTTGSTGGPGMVWINDPLLRTDGIPPFGANGVDFTKAGDTMLVANTGNDTIVQIPVKSDGSAGKAAVLANSVISADGIALDHHGNIWVASNQGDEMIVLDPSGKVIAKLGDFRGVSNDGVPQGLLFPASPAFGLDGKYLYVTNLSLDLRVFGITEAVDSQWCAKVKHYTVSKIRARIPLVGGDDNE
ncbi:MAG TPA: SMP-30/gluconolactonase/LRE family protein [Terriglobales bacterium]|nr:SMP-30/gluconolactonase/LRE family protein [Terriglobales bacterium]